LGSLFTVAWVIERKALTAQPYALAAAVDTFAPGGSSMMA
jgi:hypothetical protein